MNIAKVDVMHISTVNVSAIVTDMENITTCKNSKKSAYELSTGISKFDLDPF